MSTASPKRVLVTGARGQLAGAIIESYAGDAELFDRDNITDEQDSGGPYAVREPEATSKQSPCPGV